MIKEIDVEEMKKLVAEGALLVDVREDDEVAAGAIPGHIHMPLSDFDQYRDKLSKDKAIVFYCRSGRRSLKTGEMALEWGHKNPLYSLRGGYLAYAGGY